MEYRLLCPVVPIKSASAKKLGNEKHTVSTLFMIFFFVVIVCLFVFDYIIQVLTTNNLPNMQ